MGNMHSCTFIKDNLPIIIVVDRPKVGPDYILDPVKSTSKVSIYKHVYDSKQPPIHCAHTLSYESYVKEIARTVAHDTYVVSTEKHGKKITKNFNNSYGEVCPPECEPKPKEFIPSYADVSKI